jgi:survival-of-motor-neuron-related-splicing factor 30
MDEDLGPTLRNHQIQLQQVLAALEADPENAELQEMRDELEEVIRLTKELMTPAAGRSVASADPSGGPSGGYRFRAGDKVQAPWSENGMYYEAVVDDVMSDGQCTVSFATSTLGLDSTNSDGKHRKGTVSEVCLVSLLKPSASSGGSSYKKSSAGHDHGTDHPHKSMSRDALKKKQQKRQQKLKEFEDEREKDKNKWQQFALGKKTSKKKGLTSATGSKNRVSIFASPDGVDGRVGIGTCGISGLFNIFNHD